jgi:hypothetical protein
VGDAVPRTRRVGRFADRTQTVRSEVLAAVPAGSVVVAPPAFESLLEYDGRWKLAEWSLLWVGPLPPLPSGVPEPVTRDGKRQPSPQQPGKGEALRRKYATMSESARMQAVLGDAVKWAGAAGTYWIGTDDWTSAVARIVGPRVRFERVHRIAAGVPDGARPAERMWWLPELPVNVYRVHFDAGA